MNDRAYQAHADFEEAKRLYEYDSSTGVFKIAIRRRGTTIGRVLLPQKRGYVLMRLNGRQVSAHRVAWLLVNGAWPRGQIDHIDGNKSNNAIANLRDVSHAGNQHNRTKPQKNNLTGVLGVSRSGRDRKFTARIGVDGKKVRLGRFETAEQAQAAYVQAKRRLHAEGVL